LGFWRIAGVTLCCRDQPERACAGDGRTRECQPSTRDACRRGPDLGRSPIVSRTGSPRFGVCGSSRRQRPGARPPHTPQCAQNLSPRFGEPDSATPNVVFSSDFRVMVRRGSPVRVRKRALKSPQNGFSCCLDWYNRAPTGYGGTRRGGRGRQHCAQPSPGRTKVARACQTRRRATTSDTHKPAPLHANPHESTPSAFLELF